MSQNARFFRYGLTYSSVILIVFSIIPRIFYDFFDWGLNAPAIYVPVFTISFFVVYLLFLGKISIRFHYIMLICSQYIIGILCFLTGFLNIYEINEDNLYSNLILSGLVLSSILYLISFWSVNKYIVSPFENEKNIFSQDKLNIKLWILLGTVFGTLFVGFIQIMGMTVSWMFFGIGILFFLVTWESPAIETQDKMLQNASEPIPNSPDSTKPISPTISLLLFASILVFVPVITLTSFSAFTLPSNLSGIMLIGLGWGWFFNVLFPIKSFSNRILLITGVILGVFSLFYTDWMIIRNFLPFLYGFIGGFAADSLLSLWGKRSSVRNGLYVILCILFIFFIGGSGYLGLEMQWMISRDFESVVWGFLVIGGIGIFAFIFAYFGERRPSKKPTQAKILHSEGKEKPIISSKQVSRSLAVFSLCLLVTMPIFVAGLNSVSSHTIIIELPTTMYTVDGTPVNRVVLQNRSAIILLNSKSPQGIAYNEKIRREKSIRLGAYFYGLDGLSVSETINWIGNNLDVYSLGMCGDPFTPDNITAIKALNPLIKFYYMAFATTLFEDKNPDSPHSNVTWGLSHYPTVKFNQTMLDWTVKLKNGTEASGVRRTSNTDSAHLMDLGRMEWADYFAWIYTNRVKQFHADGVAIDEVMWRGYWDTKLSELKDYSTLDEIITTCYQWLERLDQKTDMEVMTQAFWPASQRYQNGCWGECAFRAGGQYGDRVDDRNASVWYEGNTWEGIVHDLEWQGSQNRSYIWAAWYDRESDPALEYAIATYLMGKPNNCLSLGFHPQAIYNGGYPNNLAGYSVRTMMNELIEHEDYFNLEMGDALGSMVQKTTPTGNYYERSFTNGIVLVNPYHASVPGFEQSMEKTN